MAIRPEDLPSDPAALAEMVLAFEGENEDLRAQIATLKGLIFGARSERSAIICAEQLVFDLERTADAQRPANDDEPESGAARTKRRKPRRNIGSLSAYLPRCEQVIEPASTLCPCCSGQMHRIGEETSEALDRVPAWLRVLRTIRPKYACRTCEGPIVQAKAPARLVEGGMATTALIAHIATAKYDEGGGETWAILSSLLNTARLNGVDPEAYLVDVLERMVSGRTTNDRLHELLAWNWKPEAAQSQLAA